MDASAGTPNDVTALLYAAERHSGTFGGAPLIAAAEYARSLALREGSALLACDAPGERIVGVASTLGDCPIADTSRRQDGVSVLIVAGVIAAPYGITSAASRSRSLGASRVSCLYLGGWRGEFVECDCVYLLDRDGVQQELERAR